MRHALSLLALLAAPALWGQVSLTSVTPYTQDFNSLPTGFGATGDQTFPSGTTSGANVFLPGWTVSTQDYNPGGIYSNTDSYSNSNSVRALRDASSSDYAIGIKDSTDRNFTLQLTNNTGLALMDWAISYDVEQYSTGASATVFSFSYSLNGTTFVTTNLTGASNVAAQVSSGSDANLASVLSTSRSGTISESIADGSSIWLRWTSDHISGTASHNGIDNVVVSFAAVPEPAQVGALFGALALGVALWRRRVSGTRV